jgi:hypothetical protein
VASNNRTIGTPITAYTLTYIDALNNTTISFRKCIPESYSKGNYLAVLHCIIRALLSLPYSYHINIITNYTAIIPVINNNFTRLSVRQQLRTNGYPLLRVISHIIRRKHSCDARVCVRAYNKNVMNDCIGMHDALSACRELVSCADMDAARALECACRDLPVHLGFPYCVLYTDYTMNINYNDVRRMLIHHSYALSIRSWERSRTQSMFVSAQLAATIRYSIIPFYTHSHIRVCMLIAADVLHVARGYLEAATLPSSHSLSSTYILSRIRSSPLDKVCVGWYRCDIAQCIAKAAAIVLPSSSSAASSSSSFSFSSSSSSSSASASSSSSSSLHAPGLHGCVMDVYHICVCPRFKHIWSVGEYTLVEKVLRISFPSSTIWLNSHIARFGVGVVSLLTIICDLCFGWDAYTPNAPPASYSDMGRVCCGLFMHTQEQTNIINKLNIVDKTQQRRCIQQMRIILLSCANAIINYNDRHATIACSHNYI